MQRKVSVIIPFYSHLDWLIESIDSVLSQTYKNFEIILVNDGSKEDLSDFLKKYGNEIIYIYQENSGPATARNNGLKMASGDYIAFEDSDDIWLPTKLEKQIAFMEECNALWSHTGFYYWWPKTGKYKVVNTRRDYDDIYLQRYVSTQIATPSVVLNRKIFSEHPELEFPEGKRNGEDDILYTEISRYYRIALIEEPLIKVRKRGSNSQTHAIERFNLRAEKYHQMKVSNETFPLITLLIHSIYNLYCKGFGNTSNNIKDLVAKIFWIFPYILERIYVRYLFHKAKKSERYIKRWENHNC